MATAKASTATARAAQPSVANEGPLGAPPPGAATVPPGAATMAACWAWAARRASAGETGCAVPDAAEKNDNTATSLPARMVMACPTPARVLGEK